MTDLEAEKRREGLMARTNHTTGSDQSEQFDELQRAEQFDSELQRDLRDYKDAAGAEAHLADKALAENATLRASLERMREAMDNIRYRYFPADDEGRVQWAVQTFEIARAALAETETEEAPDEKA